MHYLGTYCGCSTYLGVRHYAASVPEKARSAGVTSNEVKPATSVCTAQTPLTCLLVYTLCPIPDLTVGSSPLVAI